MIGGCAKSLETKAPAAHLTANCDQPTVDYPAVVKNEDLGVRTGKWAAAVDEANQRIEDGNACKAAERTLYGGEEK